MDPLRHFAQVWMVDFEFFALPGYRPEPLCVVARELRAGRLVRQWLGGRPSAEPPYPTSPDVLLVAYYASAEWGCHLALGWPTPLRVLDLYAEFTRLVSGTHPVTSRVVSFSGVRSHGNGSRPPAACREKPWRSASRSGSRLGAEIGGRFR